MGFWDIFTSKNETTTHTSDIHKKISELLPSTPENELIEVACIAGLLARVAYVDLNIHGGEVESMKKSLSTWTTLAKDEIEIIVSIAVDDIKGLAARENHKYSRILSESITESQRYELIKSLFALAASDGEVTNDESDEIRVISKGLRLSHKHFISARATVLDKLKALQKI